MKAAILDFGTNTFNLLIASQDGNSFRVLHSGKEPVKLGKGGINNSMITDEAMERGMNAIANHMKTIEPFNVDLIVAYATSAMRNASNGKEFAEKIRGKFGFKTNIISGNEEAELIFKGIRASVDFGNETAMIIDIGGGSNEIIICNSAGILWKHSFEIGMARIIEKFRISDPILPGEISEIESFFEKELKLLNSAVNKYTPTMMVGASGTFDTLAAMAKQQFGNSVFNTTSMEIEPEQYQELHRLILSSTSIERLAMPGMEPVRVEMIVPATIFINFVYNRSGLRSIRQSEYALKEGVMSDLITKQQ